ncbi:MULTISPECIES: DegV family protein [unclassified Anaerotruncus]|jgi:DegV family protein with EDD domain|uniref:DegV family protein n=1 Tax=unclassified Anaerotruncus TaxID=2641626 RepID=UPI00033C4D95|nr:MULTISPECIES: DegV family protein [unclassified Anaerotruncus]MCI9161190.1 DegV family protein [Anaerotruncus sp.]NCE75958.1 DegV family protein [Anaerotruncus sp. X29]RKJ83958.1 DegV family protein [Anaerotruncus sp. 1XD22-93]EOS62375.1 DegV family EDD domain-containing protein [Anaerotruncus sp. G3(2012)]MCI9236328.1 DegV family protein [Anaerotruncus sp.]
MAAFTIVTDSNSDLVPGYAAENEIIEMELTYTMDGKTYRCNDPAYTRSAFYNEMRTGKLPITAQINITDVKEHLRPCLLAGQDLLCVMFSSALSGTYHSTCLAAEELRAEFPEREICVIDTLSASLGEGMLVMRAAELRDQGMTLRETDAVLRGELPQIAALFTVDDLHHLHRGGRVSAATAVVGSMLNIKPILHVDDQGRLTAVGKVRGRKASLLELVDRMGKQMDRERCTRFAISHGDCIEDAQFVANEVCRRYGLKNYSVSYVGPTIGAHSGPGTVALFFLAHTR